MEERKLTGYPSIDKPWLKYYSEEAINAKLPERTIYEYLWENNKAHPDDVALIYFGRAIRYKTMFRHIDRAARAFYALGVRAGDIVTFAMPIIPETVYAIYGLNKLGAVCNLIDFNTNGQWILENMQKTGSQYILSLDLCYAAIQEVVEKTDIKKVVIASVADSMPPLAKLGYAANMRKENKRLALGDRCIGWRSFMRLGDKAEAAVQPYKPDLPAAIVYTGGTTGLPKGAVLSNDNINALAHQLRYTFPHFARGRRFLDIMPPVVPYGLCGGLHTPLVCGMETVIIPKYEVDKLDVLIMKYRPTHFMVVPVCYEYLLRSERLQKADLSFLILPGVGGDSMDPQLEERFNAFLRSHGSSARITKGYGLSEVSSAASASPASCNEIGSVGCPLIGNLISVFEPDTQRELPYNEKGELCICGPTTMLGYYKNEESTRAMLQRHADGNTWVHTGDYGYMREDGSVFVINRIKRIIIEADGYKVYPAPLENIIASHDAVEACGIIGISDPMHFQGQLPMAYIVLKKDVQKPFEELCAELDELCRARMHMNAVPYSYKVCESLPHTSVGKIDYRALEQNDTP